MNDEQKKDDKQSAASFRLGADHLDRMTEMAWQERKSRTQLLRDWIDEQWNKQEKSGI